MSTIVVAAILIAAVAGIVALLVFINNKSNREKTNALLTGFHKSGAGNNLSFSSQELLKNCIIGLDGVHRKLLFLKQEGQEKLSAHIIHLDQVKSCMVRKIYGSLSPGNIEKRTPEAHLEKIVLQLSFVHEAQPVEIPFYEHMENNLFEMPEKEQKAKVWEAILSKMLKKELKYTANFSNYESPLWQGF